MSKYAHLLPQLDLIECFGFWLKHSQPGWSISRPAIERSIDGNQHPIFVLYEDGVLVGTFTTPAEALARIGNDRLTAAFVSLVSSSDSEDDT